MDKFNTEQKTYLTVLVKHIEELHDEMPHDSKWVACHALATLNPNNLLDCLIRKTSVTLDVTINVHKWWLAAHQLFKKSLSVPRMQFVRTAKQRIQWLCPNMNMSNPI